MDRGAFLEAFSAARAARETFVAFCECEVVYSGRAEAFLPRGERLLVVKQDGVFLIHQPEGGMPINYLKAGGTLSLEKYEGHLMLHGRLEKEFIDVEIFTVHGAMRRKLEDGQEQTLTGNEADMSDMLRDNPQMVSKDFRPIKREEYTDVGFIDVLGHDSKGNLVVVECKRYTAGLSAVSQLHRYVEKLKQVRGTKSVTGVLAAPKVTGNALEMLTSYGYRFADVHPPKRHERHEKGQATLGNF